jgi:GT2 family glycosyltransferase
LIDLCVINYNTRPLLQRFLNHLHSDYQENVWNLYIADNGSSDDSREWLSKNYSRYNISNFIANENIGYSAAANSLAAMGSSDVIAILNADVWMRTIDVSDMQDFFNDNMDVHISGPKQRDEDGYITHAGIVGSNIKPEMRGWKKHDPGDNMYRDVVDCVTVSGSAYFIRRNVWDSMTNNSEYQKIVPGAIGAFLPTPHYYEETWCSYFARHLGYNIRYNGNVSIGHSWHKSSPIGGHADRNFPISQKLFRDACDYFNIERD